MLCAGLYGDKGCSSHVEQDEGAMVCDDHPPLLVQGHQRGDRMPLPQRVAQALGALTYSMKGQVM
jgi:hypothetical protein